MSDRDFVTRLRTPFDDDCWTCGRETSERLKVLGEWALSLSFPMYLCPECGNKRCAKARHHDNECDRGEGQ